MSKITQRILTFLIGVPAVVAVIYFDWFNHLPLNIAIIVFSILSAIELHGLFSEKTKMPPKVFCIILSFLLPLSSYLFVLFCPENTDTFTHWVFILLCLVMLVYEVFGHKTFEESNHRLSASIFLIFYCGFLLTFITKMTLFRDSTILICIFLLATFSNDSAAWLFGVLFGKNNRGIVAASPNKSIAGFIGGYAGSISLCILASFLFPEILDNRDYLKAAVLGFVTATAGIVGDLTESVFKRSAGKKDSGTLIPGRGGVLDSCDSILFAAPVYYIAVILLYHPSLITEVEKIVMAQ